MIEPDPCAFVFVEADHLTRIHLKLALEDVGFAVVEDAETIRIAAAEDQPPVNPADWPQRIALHQR
jgi:hypothetical protein